ncbi:hypothetical protein HPG69_017081 [Diceros bicornis minor]|uniref:Uncharacterized protein n=1 Tax=Diceros bicornis minor TaxID=77932 RepID=A0A7J7ECP4_DICBM|nr:hypothetical protein HPG69_017081 [Diceros bicornis minor]
MCLHNHLSNKGRKPASHKGYFEKNIPPSPANWSRPLTSPTNVSQNTLSPSAFDYDSDPRPLKIFISLLEVSLEQHLAVHIGSLNFLPHRTMNPQGQTESAVPQYPDSRLVLDISKVQLDKQINCPMIPAMSDPRRNCRDTYFGFRDLLDPLNLLIRHDIVVPDDVRTVPLILLFEGGNEQLWCSVAMVIPTEKPLLPLRCLKSTEQQALS